MTLIVALEGKDGLVLAADSRGTIGDPRGLTAVNDIQHKLFKLTNHCGIAISGSSELAARLIDQLKPQLAAKTNVDDILSLVSSFCKTQYQQWFGNRPWVSPTPVVDQRPTVAFIVCGYTNGQSMNSQSRIYILTSVLDFVPQLCQSGFMMAGIPQYATYLIHRLYDRSMNIKSLQSLAAYLITETATQDPKVGGPVRIATITPNSGYGELSEEAIQSIVTLNDKQSRGLKQFFFSSGETK